MNQKFQFDDDEPEQFPTDRLGWVLKGIYDKMDIYPISTTMPNGEKFERTEWENGWNKAMNTIMESICK